MPRAATIQAHTRRGIIRMLIGGQPDVEVARVFGVSPQAVGKIKRELPVIVKPMALMIPAVPRPVQIGEEWSEEYQFMIKKMAPAWAAGDLELDDDRAD